MNKKTGAAKPPAKTKEIDLPSPEDRRKTPDTTGAHVKAYLADELKKYDETLRHGPGGSGWRHNEAKRAEVEEIAEWLRRICRFASR